MKICPKCHTPNDDAAGFCGSCGSPLNTVSNPTTGSYGSSQGDAAKNPYGSNQGGAYQNEFGSNQGYQSQNQFDSGFGSDFGVGYDSVYGSKDPYTSKKKNKNANLILIGSIAVMVLLLAMTLAIVISRRPKADDKAGEESKTATAVSVSESIMTESDSSSVSESVEEESSSLAESASTEAVSESAEQVPSAVEVPEEMPAYHTMFVVNCQQDITLRTTPDTNAGELDKIALGEPVSFIANAENGFYKIAYNGQTGYVLATYLADEPQQVSASASAPAAVIMYVVNCQEFITLRNSPSTSAGEITKIPLGSAVTFLDTASNGFYYIEYNGAKGYGLASYLSQTPGGTNYTYSNDTLYVINCHENITLRTQPSTSANAITKIPLGAAVTYLSSASNGFYKISYGGQTGYALASYLTAPVFESNSGSLMQVVNCKEFITLRKIPDTSGEEICKIPLGATVTFKSTAEHNFYYIEYNGYDGYALSQYLR